MGEVFDIDEEIDDTEEPLSSGLETVSRKNIGIISAVVGIVFLLVVGLISYRLFNKGPDTTQMGAMSQSNDVVSSSAGMLTKDDDRVFDVVATQTTKKKKIRYVELFNQLDPDQVAMVLRELSIHHIPFRTEQRQKNYKVFVDRDLEDYAKNMLAIKGLPTGPIRGYEIFDTASNMGVTDFDKRIRLVRALSGELEKTIIQLRQVDGCKVQIVLPEQRLFTVKQPPVTASVLVRLSPQFKHLRDGTVYGIMKLVAHAVENLNLSNITVVNTRGQVLSENIVERIQKIKESDVQSRLSEITEAPSEPKDAPVTDKTVTSLTENIEQTVDDSQKEQAVRAVKSEEEPKEKATAPRSESVPTLVSEPALQPEVKTVPSEISTVEDVLTYKKSLESSLEAKAKVQLASLFPMSSFRLAIDAELITGETKKSPDIQRLMCRIVVNTLDENTVLTPETKTEIFTTIAAAIGYVKGRDTIQLTKSEWPIEETIVQEEVPVTVSPKVPEVASVVPVKKGDGVKAGFFQMVVTQTLSYIKPYWMIATAGIVFLAIMGLLGVLIRSGRVSVEKIPFLSQKTSREDAQKTQEWKQQQERMQRMARENPKKMAKIIEGWLQLEEAVAEEIR